ncbi:BadF/BadG/BcrA/BcrD ATPase family protein [Streptomyces sp. NPDC049954]|uniref:N-acetylglucosamine kinase n=1 Tax=Streptomyces sp. NPDC049954 TaxID=3155779 RepID=UPI003412BACB
MSALLLAADVGNSKTHLAVADTTGRVLGLATGPGGSPQTLGVRAAHDQLRSLAKEITGRDSGYEGAVLAVAGVDFPEEEAALAEEADAHGLARHLTVCNDTFALLRTGGRGDGIAVVAGAGINCCGRYGERTARFHSLGRLTGDWGGGIDLGEEALGTACRAEDGRGAPTSLARSLPAHFGLTRPLELAEAVHRGEVSHTRLVQLAPLVLAAADEGDAVARTLVDRMAAEVVAFVTATTERLGCDLDSVPLVLGGGLLRARCARLRTGIWEALHAAHSDPRIVVPDTPPVVGALALALDEASARTPGAAREVPLEPLAAQVADLLG